MRLLRFAAPLLLLSLAASTPHAGGAPMISLTSLPTHFVVGEAATLSFFGIQHGNGIGPEWDAVVVAGGVSAPVTRDAGGRFHAIITPVSAGKTDVSLHLVRKGSAPTAEGGSRPVMTFWSQRRLLPVTTVPPGTQPPLQPAADRGRHLYVAKGCISCHGHAELADLREPGGTRDLTGRRYDTRYLERLLLDPYSVLPQNPSPIGSMPTLVLNYEEVDALVAFINGGGG
jgi:hypothetical protein